MVAVKLWRVLTVSVAVVAALTAVSGVGVAEAAYQNVGEFAASGSGAGELTLHDDSAGVAVDDGTGEVYVADGDANRITSFDVKGNFSGAWGTNVTATGPDKAGTNQVEDITVKATTGQFILEYEGDRTPILSVEGSAKEMEEALNDLARIKDPVRNGNEEEGGKVKVEGGPGDVEGSKPYKITFEGSLADEQESNIGPEQNNTNGTVGFNVATLGVPAFEDCSVARGDVCRQEGEKGGGVGEFELPQGVVADNSCLSHSPVLTEMTAPSCKAFDSFNGDVFVLDDNRDVGVVQVFSPDGKFVTSFGERSGGPVSFSPEKIHTPVGIGMDGSGDVYLADNAPGVESRVMIFRPEAGSYGYAGEILVGEGIPAGQQIEKLAVDAVGDVYITSNEEFVYKFAPENLGALMWRSSPECRYGPVSTVLEGIAVNPTTGMVVVYSGQNHEFNELNQSCDRVGGFAGAEIAGKKENDTVSLAFNPLLIWEDGSPQGVLYAINPGYYVKELHAGLIFARPPEHPPKVDSEFVSVVGSTFASVDVSVNPDGYETSYRIQYGTEDCAVSVCAEAPVGGGDLGSGKADVTAVETLSNLLAGTTYHYRVLATNQYGTVEGPDGVFRTYESDVARLLDERAYELVSPVFTAGGEVFPPDPEGGKCECKPGITNTVTPMQSAPDGNSVVYEGGPFSDTGDAANENEYLSVRTATGWQTRDLSPLLEERSGSADGFKGFASGLSAGVLAQNGPALCENEAPEGYADLYLFGGSCNGEPGLQPLLTMATLHKLPASQFRLAFAGASADFSHIVFEADDALTPAEPPFAPAAEAGGENLYEWFGGQLRLVNVLPGDVATEPGAGFVSAEEGVGRVISSDGSRVFWTSNSDRVYVRVNGERTVAVPDPAQFLMTGSDGSKALLADGDVYKLNEAQTEFVKVADLTAGHGDFHELGLSEDLSQAYFVTSGVLADNKNEEGEVAEEGKNNLYAWHEGATVFVTQLMSNGVPGQVTPDGRYLAFESEGEVFEYDSGVGSLRCASCDTSGARPLGVSFLPEFTTGQLRSTPRYLAENGRLFFDSQNALSPYDTNKGVGDVYEYEPAGLGTCVGEEGCISLISSGDATTDSDFVTTDPSGENAFFVTRSDLVPETRGELYKLYDARVEGGFHELSPPTCTGAGCQGAPASPPIFATPASFTFSGVGNFAAPASLPAPSTVKCSKGKKLSHGKCVKPKPKKKKKKVVARKARKSRRGIGVTSVHGRGGR